MIKIETHISYLVIHINIPTHPYNTYKLSLFTTAAKSRIAGTLPLFLFLSIIISIASNVAIVTLCQIHSIRL